MQKRVPNQRGSGEQLRVDLINAAVDLLEKPQAVIAPSLRQIALAIGISPSAVYTRFGSGKELLQAAIESQYQALREEIRKVAAGQDSTLGKLEFAAIKYVQWGIEHPGSYQLLFESSDKLPDGVVAQGLGVELLGELAVLVADHMKVSAVQSQRTTLRLWAALHGITSLRIHKKNAPWSSSFEDEAKETVAAFTKVTN